MSNMTAEISLHQQLAVAHQQLAQAKTEILRLLNKEKETLTKYSETIGNIKQEVSLLKEKMNKTSLPLNFPHIKTLRDEGFDYVETLPDDLTTIKGIGPDKASKIINFLQNGNEVM